MHRLRQKRKHASRHADRWVAVARKSLDLCNQSLPGWEALTPDDDIVLSADQVKAATSGILDHKGRECLMPWLQAIESLENLHKALMDSPGVNKPGGVPRSLLALDDIGFDDGFDDKDAILAGAKSVLGISAYLDWCPLDPPGSVIRKQLSLPRTLVVPVNNFSK